MIRKTRTRFALHRWCFRRKFLRLHRGREPVPTAVRLCLPVSCMLALLFSTVQTLKVKPKENAVGLPSQTALISKRLPGPGLESHWQALGSQLQVAKVHLNLVLTAWIFVWVGPTLRSGKGALGGMAPADPEVLLNIFCSRYRGVLKNLFFSGFSWINVNKNCPDVLFFYMNTKIAAACQVCWEMDVIIFSRTVSPKGTW